MECGGVSEGMDGKEGGCLYDWKLGLGEAEKMRVG